MRRCPARPTSQEGSPSALPAGNPNRPVGDPDGHRGAAPQVTACPFKAGWPKFETTAGRRHPPTGRGHPGSGEPGSSEHLKAAFVPEPLRPGLGDWTCQDTIFGELWLQEGDLTCPTPKLPPWVPGLKKSQLRHLAQHQVAGTGRLGTACRPLAHPKGALGLGSGTFLGGGEGSCQDEQSILPLKVLGAVGQDSGT